VSGSARAVLARGVSVPKVGAGGLLEWGAGGGGGSGVGADFTRKGG